MQKFYCLVTGCVYTLSRKDRGVPDLCSVLHIAFWEVCGWWSSYLTKLGFRERGIN